MKKILSIYGIINLIVFNLIGCSGKVQTNKLPDDNKYELPNTSIQLQDKISETQINNFDRVLQEFFKDKKSDNISSIYEVGLERGHFVRQHNISKGLYNVRTYEEEF